MSQQNRVRNEQEGAPELVYNIDQLEDLVSNGKRMPMSHTVLVNEDEFIQLLDEVRTAIPVEIREAQRLLKERERLLGEAQEQAASIVNEAQRRAAMLVSDHTVLAEAKQHAEALLQAATRKRDEESGRMEVYFKQQIKLIQDAAVVSMSNMETTVEEALEALEDVKDAIESKPRDS